MFFSFLSLDPERLNVFGLLGTSTALTGNLLHPPDTSLT